METKRENTHYLFMGCNRHRLISRLLLLLVCNLLVVCRGFSVGSQRHQLTGGRSFLNGGNSRSSTSCRGTLIACASSSSATTELNVEESLYFSVNGIPNNNGMDSDEASNQNEGKQNSRDGEEQMIKATLESLDQLNVTIKDGLTLLPAAPPLSYDKFLTMQEKRVVVTVRYSEESGLRPYFLTVAKKIKATHTDIIIERRILPNTGNSNSNPQDADGSVFEVLVDGKVIVGKSKSRKPPTRGSRSVYVSMQELDVAISRARRRRRPNTVYGNDDSAAKSLVKMRVNMVRSKQQQQHQ